MACLLSYLGLQYLAVYSLTAENNIGYIQTVFSRLFGIYWSSRAECISSHFGIHPVAFYWILNLLTPVPPITARAKKSIGVKKSTLGVLERQFFFLKSCARKVQVIMAHSGPNPGTSKVLFSFLTRINYCFGL